MIVADKPSLDDDLLEHFGVLGMHWGERKDRPTYESTVNPKTIGSPITKMDKTIHSSTQDAAYQVSALLKDRYGFNVNEVKAIEDKRRYRNYLAYVEGQNTSGTIFVQPRDLTSDLKKIEEKGWFGPDCGNIKATMTHETAHSMFHAPQQYVNTGFLGLNTKITGGNVEARDKALNAAVTQAKKDGIKEHQIAKHTSGYADAAYFREEHEAELFTRYHWSQNNPKYIDVWGETLHRELGLDATPFRKVVANA